MPSIPQYQRERLASSLVGTPAVDTSGQEIAQSVAKFGAEVAQPLFEAAIERKAAMDSVEASSLHADYVVASQQALEQHKRANLEYPSDKTGQLQQILDDTAKNVSDKASNPRVKEMFAQHAAMVKGEALIKEQNWAFEQENTNTKNRIVTSNNTLASQANSLGMSTGSINDKLTALSELTRTAQQNMITAQRAGFDMTEFGVKGLQSVNGGFISGLIESDPALASKLLESPEAFYAPDTAGNKIDTLGIKEREGYKDAARKKFEGAVATAQYQQKITAAQTHGDIYSKIVKGDATLADINALESPGNTPEENKNIEALRDIYLEAKPFDVKTDSGEYLQFKVKYDKITADLKKDRRLTSPIDQVIGFDREITDAVQKKFITQEEGKNLRDMMIAPVYEKAKDAHSGGFFGLGQSHWEEGYQAIDQQLDKDKTLSGQAKEQRKYEVLKQFVSEFTKRGIKTQTDSVNLAQEIIKNNAVRTNPVLGTLPAMPNSIMTTNGQVTNILSGASKLAVEQGVQQPFVEQVSNTGKRRRVYKDGRIEMLQDTK